MEIKYNTLNLTDPVLSRKVVVGSGELPALVCLVSTTQHQPVHAGRKCCKTRQTLARRLAPYNLHVPFYRHKLAPFTLQDACIDYDHQGNGRCKFQSHLGVVVDSRNPQNGACLYSHRRALTRSPIVRV